MGKAHGASLRLYFDEFNISGFANKLSRKVKVDTAEVSNFGSAGNKEYLEGPVDFTGDFSGWFDDTAGGWDAVAFARLAARTPHYCGQVVAQSLVASAAAGDLCWEDVVQWTDQPRDYDMGGAIALSGSLQGTGGTSRGLVNYAGTKTGTGAGAGTDHGATTAPTVCVVTYRVLAVAGSGSLVVAFEECDTDTPASYAAVAALASGTITVTSDVCDTPVVRKTTAGSTKRWKRINVTTFDTITSATLLVTCAVLKSR